MLPKDTLQASDLIIGKCHLVTIGRHPAASIDRPDSCAMRELRQTDNTMKAKPLLAMEGKKKYLVLNSTNVDKLIDLTGEEDSVNWIGKRVALYRTKVRAFGEMKDAIRITKPDAKHPPTDMDHGADEDEAPFRATDVEVPF